MSESAANRSYFSHSAVAEAWSRDAELYPAECQVVDAHFPPAGARVLDIGCGAGRTTIALTQRGYRVTAIDYSRDMVRAARARMPDAEVLQMDATALAFPDRSFDAALFSFNGLDGMHPLELRRRALGEMARVVRPRGIIYYTGHNWLGALGRPGVSGFSSALRQKANFLFAQRPRLFAGGYGVYRDQFGDQILHHRSPFRQLRLAAALGLRVRALYGSARFKDREWRAALPDAGRVTLRAMDVLRVSIGCPHVHYVLEAHPA